MAELLSYQSRPPDHDADLIGCRVPVLSRVSVRRASGPHPEDRPPGRSAAPPPGLDVHREAKRAYRQRKLLVEPVFGIIKEQLQARSFLLRGLNNVGRVVPAGYSLNLSYMAPGAGPRVHKRSATPNQAAQARSGQVSTDKRRGISYMSGDRCRNDIKSSRYE